MLQTIFSFLESIDDVLWGYVCFPVILFVGIYFSFRSRFVQLRKFPQIVKTFFSLIVKGSKVGDTGGIHPLKASFASIGASVGIGNIVLIVTAVELGGPGALFWIWVTAIVGSIVKYSEVCLGMQFRVSGDASGKKGFAGGPMYYLEKAFSSWAVKLFCFLMCLYGAEILQFNVVASSIANNFELPLLPVALGLVGLVILADAGGIDRVGTICAAIIPLFIVLYLAMGFYVIAANIDAIPAVFSAIMQGAFSPTAAIGGFAGCSLITTISQGIKKSCYSSDIGVGYASIIHSESSERNPARQASLTIFEVFLDIFVICTMSVLIVLATGVWNDGSASVTLVQQGLARHFPYMHIFMPVFLFMLGYTTIITYFVAGMKAAEFLFPRAGRALYYLFGSSALVFFTFQEITEVAVVMSLVLAGLLLLNLSAIWRLRNHVRYNIADVVSDEVPVMENVGTEAR